MKINYKSNIKDLASSIKEQIGVDGFRKALRNAINATATQVKKSLPRETTDVWNVTAKDVSDKTNAIRVSREGLAASVVVRSKSYESIKFATSPKPLEHWKRLRDRPSHVVKALLALKKGEYTMPIPSNAVGKPFIATVKAGGITHTGVFVRISEMGREPRNRASWKWTKWKNTPASKLQKIVQLYVIPVSGMVRNKEIVNNIRDLEEKVFIEKFNQKLEDQLKKIKGS